MTKQELFEALATKALQNWYTWEDEIDLHCNFCGREGDCWNGPPEDIEHEGNCLFLEAIKQGLIKKPKARY
jgi:hypothetical protein